MNGKVVMVTGATNGIGVVTAVKLAQMGAEVVIVSRNKSKLEDTVRRIKADTGNDAVTYIQADLSSLSDIRKAADTFLNTHNRLDVLVNNAGGVFGQRQETIDGYEMTFALNHLNYFLLTNLLLETIKQTATEQGEARVVNVSSSAHKWGKINFDNLERKRRYNNWLAYSDSKLMNVMFTYELARRLDGTGVTANVLHPGLVNTGFGMSNNGRIVTGVLNIYQNLLGKSPNDGAATNIYLASSPEVEGITGKYWVDKKQKRSNSLSYDVETQKRLWEVSEQLTGLTQGANV
ncbi:MAG: SDR family oxidoreductase [Anaerolineae bacterium]|nr:SDR family oxidoreductase [Anaerolineae bacterium]MDQ7037364.1 SDR family oxidoreductase [Anaerolineae bacterium]